MRTAAHVPPRRREGAARPGRSEWRRGARRPISTVASPGDPAPACDRRDPGDGARARDLAELGEVGGVNDIVGAMPTCRRPRRAGRAGRPPSRVTLGERSPRSRGARVTGREDASCARMAMPGPASRRCRDQRARPGERRARRRREERCATSCRRLVGGRTRVHEQRDAQVVEDRDALVAIPQSASGTWCAWMAAANTKNLAKKPAVGGNRRGTAGRGPWRRPRRVAGRRGRAGCRSCPGPRRARP